MRQHLMVPSLPHAARQGPIIRGPLEAGLNDSPRMQQLSAYHEMAGRSPQATQLRALQTIADRFAARQSGVAQRAPHRPQQGSQIRYQGQLWTVAVSAIANPNITITRPPNHTVHLPWATANFTIIRANNNQDHDLRENDLGALGGPVDAYAGLSSFEHQAKVRQKFSAARLQALQMIKNAALQHVNVLSQASLNGLTLEDFPVTRRGPTLVGAGKAEEAAEWETTWVEGPAHNPRRTWTFVIDSDNPLAVSTQDPHVGWTVSAAAGTQGAVGNTFGHVWVDHVPVMR